MIGSILANECAKILRSTNSWDDSKCEIAPNGQPWASSGDFFVGVFPTEDFNVSIDKTYLKYMTSHGFTCRVSRRVLGTPHDRLHKIYVEETLSLARIANTVRQVLLDNRETIRANVNTQITGDSNQTDLALQRTFTWLSTDSELTERDNAWFRSTQRDKTDSFNLPGYSIDVRFGNALGCVATAQ